MVQIEEAKTRLEQRNCSMNVQARPRSLSAESGCSAMKVLHAWVCAQIEEVKARLDQRKGDLESLAIIINLTVC